jgi:hypothetical protein
VEDRPRFANRRSGEFIEYDRRTSREVDFERGGGRREIGWDRPRSSRSSVGLPAGYVREVRPRY